uniref:CSD domain-containing protein n=1 Tax=Eutreptiella gymnastica TaxID=73025 RepID=A0A7S4D304_9EUGL
MESWQRDQENLKKSLVEEDHGDFKWVDVNEPKPTYIAGVDLNRYVPGSDEEVASLVLMEFPSLEVVYQSSQLVTLTTPAVSGYLGFREAKPIMDLIKTLIATHPQMSPQLILVHGNGKYDFKGFGLACHIGVTSGLPTIGVTNKWLDIDGLAFDQINVHAQNGEAVELLGKSNTLWGMAFVAPSGFGTTNEMIYASVGNKLSIQTAVKLVRATTRTSLPEPILQAVNAGKATADAAYETTKKVVGKVDSWNHQKGFGFIASSSGNFHVKRKAIKGDNLKKGQQVSFNISKTGDIALNVEVVSSDMQDSKQENQQAHALENLDVDHPVNVPQGYYADHPRNVMTAAVEITHPEDSEYGAFDRSALTEDAISIVRNHVLTHGNLDITVQEVAAQLRDFLGSESPESSAIAARVLDVWQTKNAILHAPEEGLQASPKGDDEVPPSAEGAPDTSSAEVGKDTVQKDGPKEAPVQSMEGAQDAVEKDAAKEVPAQGVEGSTDEQQSAAGGEDLGPAAAEEQLSSCEEPQAQQGCAGQDIAHDISQVLQFTGKDDYTPGDVGLEAAQRTEEVLRAQQQADEEEEEDTGVEEAKEEETESKMQVEVEVVGASAAASASAAAAASAACAAAPVAPVVPVFPHLQIAPPECEVCHTTDIRRDYSGDGSRCLVTCCNGHGYWE